MCAPTSEGFIYLHLKFYPSFVNIHLMPLIRTIMAVMLLSSTLRAEDRLASSSGLMTNQAMGAAVTAVTPLPEGGMPGHKRTFVLVLGIAALGVTFHQALANRKTAL